MQILNLNKSKKVAEKLLRRLDEDDYDERGVNLYFDHKVFWIRKLFWKLGWHHLSGSIFNNCDLYYYDDQVRALRPKYENNIEFSRAKLFNFQRDFFEALEKSLDNNIVYGQYLDSKFKFEDIDNERRLVSLSANEISNTFDLFSNDSFYLFTNNNDFCLHTDGEVIIFSGSQGFMTKFRNNFPNIVNCIFTDDMIRRSCSGWNCK
jgi:hypothetical protein